jgi:hypothetical protein
MHFVDVIVFARTKVDAVVSEIKKKLSRMGHVRKLMLLFRNLSRMGHIRVRKLKNCQECYSNPCPFGPVPELAP